MYSIVALFALFAATAAVADPRLVARQESIPTVPVGPLVYSPADLTPVAAGSYFNLTYLTASNSTVALDVALSLITRVRDESLSFSSFSD